jgi:hypothetical protein
VLQIIHDNTKDILAQIHGKIKPPTNPQPRLKIGVQIANSAPKPRAPKAPSASFGLKNRDAQGQFVNANSNPTRLPAATVKQNKVTSDAAVEAKKSNKEQIKLLKRIANKGSSGDSTSKSPKIPDVFGGGKGKMARFFGRTGRALKGAGGKLLGGAALAKLGGFFGRGGSKGGLDGAAAKAGGIGGKLLDGLKGIGGGARAAGGLLKRIPLLGAAITGLFALSDMDTINKDSSLTDEQKSTKKAGVTGGAAGALGGMAAGAAIGTMIFPGVGTVIGGIIGGIGGEKIGKTVGEWLYKRDWKGSWDNTRTKLSTSFDRMTGGISGMASVAWKGFSARWATSAKQAVDKAKEFVAPAVEAAGQSIGAVKAAYNGQEVQGANADGSQTKAQQVGGAVGGAGKKIVDFLSGAGYAMTQKYDNVRYKMGGKNINSGEIDCSGWSFQVSKMEMDNVNKIAGKQIFSQSDINKLNTGAVEQIASIAKENGVVTSTRNGKFDKSKLAEGMSVGQYKQGNNYSGRTAQIDGKQERLNHIAKVVKDPKTGQLMISESHGSGENNGVTLTALDKWVDMREKRGDTLIAVDALKKAREIIGGNSPAAIGGAQTASYNASKSGAGGRLGSLSAEYEGKIGSANNDNIGMAYGKFQFNNSNGGLQTFMKAAPEYARQFAGLTSGTKAFGDKWREIAQRDPKGFEAAQEKAATENWYNPAAKHAGKLGYKLDNRGIQEAIFSGAINHGGIKKIMSAAAAKKGFAGMSADEQIKAFYEARNKYVETNISKKDPNSQKTVQTLKDRYEKELPNALRYSQMSRAGTVAKNYATPPILTAIKAPTVPTMPAFKAPDFAIPTFVAANTSGSNGKSGNSGKGSDGFGHSGANNAALAQIPVSQRVSNDRIAWTAGGGIGMG